MSTLETLYILCASAYLLSAVFAVVVLQRADRMGFVVAPLATTGLWAAAAAAQEHFLANGTVLEWALSAADSLAALQSVAWLAMLFRFIAIGSGDDIYRIGFARSLGVIVAVAVFIIVGENFSGIINGLAGGKSALLLTLIADLTLAVSGLVLVENLWRNASRDFLWDVKFLSIAVTAFFVFDFVVASDALLWQQFDANILPARPLIHLLALPLVMISVTRLRRNRRQVAISRRVAFHTAAAVIAGGYLLLIGLAGYYIRYFGGEWGTVLQVTFVCMAFIGLATLLSSGSLRGRMRNFVSSNLFDLKYDYREEWLRFIDTLAQDENAPDIRDRLIRGIADLVDSPGGALWVWDDAAQCYLPGVSWNFEMANAKEAMNTPFVEQLLSERGVVSVTEERARPASHLPNWVAEDERAWLVVPLVHRERLLGFIVLRQARGPRDVDWEDFALLRTVGRQAASYLAEHLASRVLAENQDLQLFNRRFAFVIHDIKTVIYQMSLLLKNADRHAGNPEFQKDLLISVGESVESMQRILSQINAERQKDRQSARLDLGALVQQMVAKRLLAGSPVKLAIADRQIVVMGEEAGVSSVVNQLLQNALEVTSKDESVTVKVDVEERWGRVSIEDRGPGMSEEFVRDHLFKPLRTTKQSGYGIGMFQARDIVRELGGRLLVDSKPGRGTIITILFPLATDHSIAANIAKTA